MSTWLVSNKSSSQKHALHNAINVAKRINGFQYGYETDKKLSSNDDDVGAIIRMNAKNKDEMQKKRDQVSTKADVFIVCMMSEKTSDAELDEQ